MKGRILLVEDDPNLGFVTQDNLELEGYDVDWFKDGRNVLKEFKSKPYDLCILDVMLPEKDGFTIAKEIRQQDEFIPILFLTARSLEEDRLKGFEIGGDDYITKPFSVKELIYRVDVFLRRQGMSSGSSMNKTIRIGNYEFDPENLVLSHGDDSRSLTRMESELMLCLIRGEAKLVRRSDILLKVWGEDDYFKGRSLDVFISRLRKYLSEDPSIKIQNHHGVGFSIQIG